MPEWARQKAAELAQAETTTWDIGKANLLAHTCYISAFARYIAAHEEPPVDPLLAEAQEIVRASYPEVSNTYRGRRITIALAALRRGIQIGSTHE